MARKYLRIRLDGKEYKLRLTIGGQRNLRARFGEAPIDLITAGIGDEGKLTALLTEALSWPDSGNTITDGEEFYDLLVDNGYAGQEQFAALAMDIAAVSGIMSPDLAGKVKKSTERMLRLAYDKAFGALDETVEQLIGDAEPEDGTEENPTTQPNG